MDQWIDIPICHRYTFGIPHCSAGGATLELVKVSPKFQVVIPKAIREELQLHSGQELQMYILDGVIRIHPRLSVQDLDTIVPNMKWKDIYRDRDDRF